MKSYTPNPNAQGGRAFCTRTILLSTLVEVARVSATPDWGAETRPSMAIAESIEGFKEQELRMSCVMAQVGTAGNILQAHADLNVCSSTAGSSPPPF